MSEPLLERFQREVQRDVLADSYLFLGPSRQRLRAFGLAAASALLDCRSSVAEHADFLLFDPEALGVKGLRVEHITERGGGEEHSVESQLRYRPMQGGRRAVLLLDTDRMTADAQAALLKTAEEPPAGTVFLLTAVEQSPILPALRSRCRTYRVATPSSEELQRQAATVGIEPEEWRLLVQAAGRPEAVFDWSERQRGELLELQTVFYGWLQQGGMPNWLRMPEGGLAEQRQILGRELAACLGWGSAAYVQANPALALRLDQLLPALTRTLGDLAGQLAPGLLLERLQKEVLLLSIN